MQLLLGTGRQGFWFSTLKEGDGVTFPTKGQELEMHYVGTLASNGEEFDSSRRKGRTFK